MSHLANIAVVLGGIAGLFALAVAALVALYFAIAGVVWLLGW